MYTPVVTELFVKVISGTLLSEFTVTVIKFWPLSLVAIIGTESWTESAYRIPGIRFFNKVEEDPSGYFRVIKIVIESETALPRFTKRAFIVKLLSATEIKAGEILTWDNSVT